MSHDLHLTTRAPRRLLATLALLLSSAAMAHAHLAASNPAANATITQPLAKVTPTFSEPGPGLPFGRGKIAPWAITHRFRYTSVRSRSVRSCRGKPSAESGE